MYYPSSENKGADQLCSYCTADLRLCFRICKIRFFYVTLNEKLLRNNPAIMIGLSAHTFLITSDSFRLEKVGNKKAKIKEAKPETEIKKSQNKRRPNWVAPHAAQPMHSIGNAATTHE